MKKLLCPIPLDKPSPPINSKSLLQKSDQQLYKINNPSPTAEKSSTSIQIPQNKISGIFLSFCYV